MYNYTIGPARYFSYNIFDLYNINYIVTDANNNRHESQQTPRPTKNVSLLWNEFKTFYDVSESWV